MSFFTAFVATFVISFILVPAVLAIARAFCLYVVIRERQCVVFELFGKVRWVADDPGLHYPWMHMGPFAAFVPFFGHRRFVDLRQDQAYLRSQPVNSEEGAPMGIGVWYEMYVSDPISYLYKNADPAGSLRANVSNATVRCLSNMKLERMLEDRHSMSTIVREEVSLKSQEWGYKSGSVYVRKVHFRDSGMISQIEQKVVNRLRQVTAAIQQDGANRVSVIRSAAEREASTEFAKAAAMRPNIVGAALGAVSRDRGLCDALFDVLEAQNLLKNPQLRVTVIPAGGALLAQLEAEKKLRPR
ncbi:MAG TPA: SPFH domain-containing protein [Polyangiales bacterium]|jgi:regulator of protease activity HflC (stomatin/prohibitin superfamily)|nr:SPFH domain-containing protein [Polyangiales bacterium]